MSRSSDDGAGNRSRNPSGRAGFIRQYNRWLIANLLRREGPLSRTDLAGRLGLSPPAVSRIVGGLVSEGYVRETGLANTAVGRRPRLLDIRAEAGCALGVDLRRVNQVEVGLVDIQGRLLLSRSARLESTSPSAVVDTVGHLFEAVLAEAGEDLPRPMAAGLACPGVINFEDGSIEYSAHLGWRDVPIRDRLHERLGLPIFVDTDCNAPALAESWLGAGAAVNDMVYLALGPGLGIGMVIGGSIYRGASGVAGELGHTVIQIEGGRTCRCGYTGCVETLLSEEAVVESAQAEAAAHGGALRGMAPLSVADVFAAAEAGDAVASRVVERVSGYLAVVVTNVLTLLNPELLVLDAYPGSQDALLPVAQRAAAECALPLVGRGVRIEAPSLGDKTVLVGAAMLVMERFWQAPVFDISTSYQGLAGTRSIGRSFPASQD